MLDCMKVPMSAASFVPSGDRDMAETCLLAGTQLAGSGRSEARPAGVGLAGLIRRR